MLHRYSSLTGERIQAVREDDGGTEGREILEDSLSNGGIEDEEGGLRRDETKREGGDLLI